MEVSRISVLLRAAACEHGSEIGAAAEPAFRGHHHARVHMRGGHIRIYGMGDEGDAARPEARVLLGARNLLGEFRGKGAVHGRGVAADLLEHAAGHQRHDAAAALSPVLLGAGPRGLHEAAGGFARAAGKAFGLVLDPLERRANLVAQMLEPEAGTFFPRRAEGLRQICLFRCFLVHRPWPYGLASSKVNGIWPRGFDRDQHISRDHCLCLICSTLSVVRQFAQVAAPGQP